MNRAALHHAHRILRVHLNVWRVSIKLNSPPEGKSPSQMFIASPRSLHRDSGVKLWIKLSNSHDL